MTDVPPATSVHMIFEFTADEVRLVEQHPVGAVPDQLRDHQAGDHVEIRERDGRTVNRVPLRTGLGRTVETFPQDPYIGAATAHAVPEIGTVVVAAPLDADHVTVVRDREAGTEVLGTFRLRR